MSPFQEGDQALLIDRAGRRYVVSLRVGAAYSMHAGQIAHDDLIGHDEGTMVSASKGARLIAVRPTLAESILEMPRQAQVIYPKDLGIIWMWMDLQPGLRVFESGIGPGALSQVILRAIGPSGRLVVVEHRPDFVDMARRNIGQRFGEVPPNLEVHVGDVYEGMVGEGYDRVFLDVPEPWRVVGFAAQALRPGGLIFAHTPTVIQAQQYVEALLASRAFGLDETMEVLQRGWNIRGRSVRPAHRMVAHTGFLTFARRLAGGHLFEEGKISGSGRE